MRNVLSVVVLTLLLAAGVFAQQTSLSGVVSDPSGAVIPGATVTITNSQTGATRESTSDTQGRYNFVQVTPGTFKLSAKAQGFAEQVVNNIELLVNSPATVNVAFEKVGTVSETVAVEASAVQVNTTDASLGNAIGTQAILQLPFFARNVAGLLQFQPGVTSFGTTDDRNGSVNGGRSDQANVSLDGVDVNDQNTRAAFTSVLRVTLDSVEEFRTTTTNGGADTGRGSGADIALVTKSGTNSLHGSLYEYRRGTETAANSFFNNRSGIPIPALLINVFGGSVGGPIKKNKAFFFMNYEGRRDASAVSVNRTVPTEDLKQGIVNFHNAAGQLTSVNGAFIQSTVDPLGIGLNPAALKVLQAFPKGNNNVIGDGLNTTGFLFNAAGHADQNTYIARFDYKLDEAGKHSLFFRGNLQNDSASNSTDGSNAPQFPGQPPNSVTLANNKGYGIGWTGVITPTIVNSLRYGFTRAGGETTGILSSSYTTFRGISAPFGTSTGIARIIPVHTIGDDLTWTKGAHELHFGGIGRLISNASVNYAHSYNTAITNASVINGSGADLIPSSLSVLSGDKTSYEYAMVAVLGIVTSGTGNYNYLTDGTTLPVGAPVTRNFVNHELEMYAQDTWKLKRNLTVTYGLRLSYMPPVFEANGQQVSTNIPIGAWMDNRGAAAAQGLGDQSAGLISFIRGGAAGARPIYPSHTNPAPRLAIAYSPKAESGLSKFFFGGAGKTSIRAGAGIYFDEIGQPLAQAFNATAFGLSSTLSTPPNVLTSAQLPRFTTATSVPTVLVPAAPPGGFPDGRTTATYPSNFAITNSIDDNLKAPYTMNLDFSIGREFGHGIFVQGSYVGRLSRHSLIQRDLAMPTNLKDPKSGQTYFQAMSQLATYTDFQGLAKIASNGVADVSAVPKIPFFENFWSTAAGNGLTATQVIAKDYLERSNPGDFTNVLSDMDAAGCGPTSTFSSIGKLTRTACGTLGQYSMWSPQFSALNAWTSLGTGSYHAAQLTVRKRFSSGLLFDLNYTLSKSEDIGSRAESSGTFSTDFMINSWEPAQLKGVSRFDTLHAVNAFMVYQLPFGRGKRFGSNMNKIMDIFVGGWQISGTYRQTSGLPFNVSDGSRWATNWELSSFATPNGQPIPQAVTAKNAPAISGPGGPNLWADPAAALAGFSETLAGQTGPRNALRGAGFFDIDSGVGKTFTMPYNEHHQVQFRWESFNLTNTARLDPNSANVSLTSTAKFGQLSTQLGSPRQMQFALRYSF